MLTTCSKCGSRYANFTIRGNDLTPGVDIAKLAHEHLLTFMDKLVANAPDDSLEPRQKQELFEAALGTLSMVANEVPELQAAKIRGAIDVLLISTDRVVKLCYKCSRNDNS